MRRHDVGVDDPPETGLDLVHARLVLTHVPRRDAALAAMVAALRPGGHLLLEEADPGLQPLLCPDEYGPEQELANRLRHGFRTLMAGRDADLAYGRTLPRRLRELGLREVGADAYFPISSPACTELEVATVAQIRDRLVAGGHRRRRRDRPAPRERRGRARARSRDVADDQRVGPHALSPHVPTPRRTRLSSSENSGPWLLPERHGSGSRAWMTSGN